MKSQRQISKYKNKFHSIQSYLEQNTVTSKAELQQNFKGSSAVYSFLSDNHVLVKLRGQWKWNDSIPVSSTLVVSALDNLTEFGKAQVKKRQEKDRIKDDGFVKGGFMDEMDFPEPLFEPDIIPSTVDEFMNGFANKEKTPREPRFEPEEIIPELNTPHIELYGRIDELESQVFNIVEKNNEIVDKHNNFAKNMAETQIEWVELTANKLNEFAENEKNDKTNSPTRKFVILWGVININW